ncbi:helix-turn-helix domain-containing protein [Krasilnikovia sp. M28-CT-15]|uniref:AraC family transcriptional regulator n=1 Tax=Krasilnikovia sp. M28-CT-15 TaxID=3373540 RepID=UPI003875B7E4
MSDQDTTADRCPDGDATAPDGRETPRHISRIHTQDPDEHYAWIATRYNGHRRQVRPRSRGFEFFSESGAVGALTLDYSRYTAATSHAAWPPMPFVAAGRLLSGRHQTCWHGTEVRVAKHGVLLFPPDGFSLLNDCCWYASVRMPLGVLQRVAEEQTGLDPAGLHFTDLRPISPAAQRQWLVTVEFVRRGIYTGILEPPLLLAAAEQAVAASLLATFPNTATTTEQRRPRDPAGAATVRRAIAFIDAHAGEPITVTDIAAAAQVGPRTLGQAFHRHRDTTPLAYLRRVRLARAHDQLLAAQPGDGTTVAAVAVRWGFGHIGRFTGAYRQEYGQPPGQTLRR